MRQQSMKNFVVDDVAAQPTRRLVDVSNETDFGVSGENHVAKLQNLIYDRFSHFDPQADQSVSEPVSKTEWIVSGVSRIAGVVVFVAALGAVVSLIF